uniref:C-type lectin n=1 Tax=Phalotris mertensi TaxID=1260334 RepID=A0A182C5S9_9SAUR
MGRFIFVNLGLLVVAFSLRGSGADCPSDWSSHDKYCYKVFDERKNWDEAETFCMNQKTGSHLVSILSSNEGNYVANLVLKSSKKPSVWIGLSNIWNACSWQWSDGSSLDYKAWAEGPSCALLSLNSFYFDWFGIECKKAAPFICKFPAKP